jgi:hypothetical protein
MTQVVDGLTSKHKVEFKFHSVLPKKKKQILNQHIEDLGAFHVELPIANI